jgi:ubiquinone/menaquinone biosynthesis C-methylase UbiE
MNNFSEGLVGARMAQISTYLQPEDKILDIGSGNCFLAERLQSQNYDVTTLDVVNKSKVSIITPIIYNGRDIPFEDSTFDVALLITVMHHAKDPVRVLSEAKRVAKRIIIMEDLYSGQAQKYATFLMDSVLNLEFFGHPHTNKTNKEWLQTFENLGLNVIEKKQNNFWKFFTNGTYYLTK